MTIKACYAFFNRIHVRGWLLAAALGCVWLNAHAVNKNNIGRIEQSSNGRSTTLGPVTNSGGSTIPVSPNLGGWTQAGNYGVPPGATGTTMNRTSSGEAIIAGQRYPFQAGYQEPKSNWVMPALGAAAAIGCTFATGGVAAAACLGLPVALPYLYEWITRAGGRINPDTGQLERADTGACTTEPCYSWFIQLGADAFPHRSRPETACEDAVGWYAANTSYTWRFISVDVVRNLCIGEITHITSGQKSAENVTLARGPTRDPDSPTWYPSSMDDIAPYMRSVNPDGRVWGEALERGAEFPQPLPTVTGPSQIQGPEKSTTNPDGSRTVERTTYNFNTAGNTINNTSNVTTTTTYNTDNSVRSSTRTETTPTAEEVEKEDECAKRPNSVGCADLDTPTGEIPRETKTITYAEESVFGGGSCPSDKQWSSGTTGHSYKLVDWTTLCGFALPARALVILLAIFAAFLIVMPGKEVRT